MGVGVNGLYCFDFDTLYLTRKKFNRIKGLQSYAQHYSITALQHYSITALQHHSITASQHHSITAYKLLSGYEVMHRQSYAQAKLCTGKVMHRQSYAQAKLCTGKVMHRQSYAQLMKPKTVISCA